VSFNAFQTQKIALHYTSFLRISLQIAESQPVASICCKSHEGPPLSFMASDSEPKKIFDLQMLVGEF
jgi:hypothetical protein